MAAEPFIIQARDGSNAVEAGAKLYAYAEGTTTPQNMFTDAGLGTPTANPAVADSAGRLIVWLDTSLTYKLILTTSDGSTTLAYGDNFSPSEDSILTLLPTSNVYNANLAAFVDVFTLPTTDGADGQSLITDGAGVLGWETPAGGGDALKAANETIAGDWVISSSLSFNAFGLTATFTGSGADALFSRNAVLTTTSEDTPEIGDQVTIIANTGSSNKTSAFKMGRTTSVIGEPNSAYVYGQNDIVRGYGGSYLTTGFELNLQNVGTDQTVWPTDTDVNGFVVVSGGTARCTAAYSITNYDDASRFTYGLALVDGGATLGIEAFLYDISASVNILKAAGAHTNGINLAGATFSGTAFSSPGFTVDGDGIVVSLGVSDGSDAAAGDVGEYKSSTSSGVSLTSDTPADLTSLSLEAGDWDVDGSVGCIIGGGAAPGYLVGWVTATSATAPAFAELGFAQMFTNIAGNSQLPTGTRRFSLSGTTTIYLGGQLGFTSGTVTGTGSIRARRVR